MGKKKIERINYFTGEALLTKDFQVEQEYHKEMLQFHNRTLHTWGIAQGLEVSMNDSNTLTVSKGVAIDSKGNEIILLQDKVIILNNLNSALYYLTITYQEILTDFNESTGVKGFKRIVAEPLIQLQENNNFPSQDILLSIISLAPDKTVQKIEYAEGQHQRRHAGIVLGTASFYFNRVSEDKLPTLSAKSNNYNSYWLEVDSPLTVFNEAVNIQGNLSVGLNDVTGNFSVNAIRFKGKGTVSISNNIITHDNNIFDPSLEVGDTIILLQKPGKPLASCTITKIIDASKVEVSKAFEITDKKLKFLFERAAVAKFSNYTNKAILQINNDGSVGIGQLPLSANKDSPFSLQITADGNVGIGMTDPATTLDVNGTVQAIQYRGDGSLLTGITGLWSLSSVDTKNIYYDLGSVGVGTSNPNSTLEVISSKALVGSGIISSKSKDNTVYGSSDTKFSTEIAVGDIIQVGKEKFDKNSDIKSQSAIVTEVYPNTFTVDKEFKPPLTDARYHIKRPIAQFRATSNTTVPPTLTIIGRKVGINTATPSVALEVNGYFSAHGLKIDKNIDVDSIKVESFIAIAGAQANNSALTVNGSTTLSGDLSVSGAATFSDGLTVSSGNATIPTLAGNTTFQNNVTVNNVLSANIMQVFGNFQQVAATLTGSTTGTSGANTATSDGFIIGTITVPYYPGTNPSAYDSGMKNLYGTDSVFCAGQIAGCTSSISGSPWVFVASAGTFDAETDSARGTYAPLSSTFIMPVKNGDTWQVCYYIMDSNNVEHGLDVYFYFVPLGTGGTSGA